MNVEHVQLGPGQTCPVCTRRIPYERKPSSKEACGMKVALSLARVLQDPDMQGVAQRA